MQLPTPHEESRRGNIHRIGSIDMSNGTGNSCLRVGNSVDESSVFGRNGTKSIMREYKIRVEYEYECHSK